MALPIENDEGCPLNPDDQLYFDAIVAKFGTQCTTEMAIRLARGYRHEHKPHRMQSTLAEVERVLAWRQELQVDTILTRPLPQSKRFFECWPSFMYGEDREGHLVTSIRAADIDMDSMMNSFRSVDEMLAHRAQYMERVMWETAAISRRRGRRVYKHICIIDLQGLRLKHMTPSLVFHLKVRIDFSVFEETEILTVDMVQPFFDVGQDYYRGTLLRAYLVNAPMLFHSAWKLISSLMDPLTVDKVHVVVSAPVVRSQPVHTMSDNDLHMQKNTNAFLESAKLHGIPLDSLPTFLGGRHPGRPADDSFAPSVPDTPLPVAKHAQPSREPTDAMSKLYPKRQAGGAPCTA